MKSPFSTSSIHPKRCSSALTPLAYIKPPPVITHDYLSPTPSRLLSITLNDLYPVFPPLPPLPHQISTSATTKVALPPSLPLGHHLAYFPVHLPPSALLPDGTDPAHLPPLSPSSLPYSVPPRRLWAGGRVEFAPAAASRFVLDGRPAVCVEQIGDVAGHMEVDGRDGIPRGRATVEVWRRYGLAQDLEGDRLENVLITERRTLVFLPPLAAGGSVSRRAIASPRGPDVRVSIAPSRTHLFNFSAVSYNAHVLHVDTHLTRLREAQPSLVVHGPLTLVLMLAIASSHLKNQPPHGQEEDGNEISAIEYKNLVPLYCDEVMHLCLRTGDASSCRRQIGAQIAGFPVWIEKAGGELAVKGRFFTSPSRNLATGP